MDNFNIKQHTLDNKKNPNNILVMATGPSVFYNLSKIKQYIETYNPLIIGINGYLHGILTIKKQLKNIDILLPDILFSFLLIKDKHTIDGKTIIKDADRKKLKCNLFKHFVVKHKKTIINNNIAIFCPNNRSQKIIQCKRAYGIKQYGQAKWYDYKNYFEFDVLPKKYKRGRRFSFGGLVINDVTKDTFDSEGYIKFRPKPGGQYVLAWAVHQNPTRIATCGICDFVSEDKTNQHRGWFWVDDQKSVSRRTINQEKLISLIKAQYKNRYTNLNLVS